MEPPFKSIPSLLRMFLRSFRSRNILNVRRYSDSSHVQAAIHKEFQSIEEAYRKLGLDELKTVAEVEKLFIEGKINSQIADYLKHTIQRRTEATKSGDYWKRLFLFIGIPSIALVGINTYFIEEKHHKHLEEHPPAFTPYEHMKIRTKKFFWGDGDSALFQHPKYKQ